MTTNDNNLGPKKPTKFECILCHFRCCYKKDYERHINTIKHKNNELTTFDNGFSPKNPNSKNLSCENCEKLFNDRTGLWRHKKKCTSIKIKSIDNKNEFQVLTNIVLEVVKNNQELQKQNQLLIEQSNHFQQNIMEMCKNGIVTNNINNTHTNSHNKTFNLQFFLNETCKDAMNIMDFVDSIKLQLNDLEKVGEMGYIEGISNIIIKNLKELDVTERPVHCTDSKREVLYIKDENKWEKENESKNKMKKAIKRVANKNISLLPEFKEKYPDCIYSESKKSDQYNKIIIEAFQLDNSEKQEKIIKKIAKEVTIDKNDGL